MRRWPPTPAAGCTWWMANWRSRTPTAARPAWRRAPAPPSGCSHDPGAVLLAHSPGPAPPRRAARAGGAAVHRLWSHVAGGHDVGVTGGPERGVVRARRPT